MQEISRRNCFSYLASICITPDFYPRCMYPVTAQPTVVVLGDRGTDPPPGEKLQPRLDGPSWCDKAFLKRYNGQLLSANVFNRDKYLYL
jgi:hypothetical protein